MRDNQKDALAEYEAMISLLSRIRYERNNAIKVRHAREPERVSEPDMPELDPPLLR